MAEISRSTLPAAPNGWPRSLLEGFRAGDPAALGEVYEQHAREVAVVLRNGFEFSSLGRRHRFVGYASTHDLQDALHETFRRAFEPRARRGYDGLRPYGPYVRTIARNVVLARFRKTARTFVPLDTTDAAGTSDIPTERGRSATLSDDGISPEQRIHDEQVKGLMESFLAKRDELERRLVALRFIEGRSQRDAAVALGLGRQRVRTLEQRLRRSLIDHLRASGAEDLLPTGLWLVCALPGGVEFAVRCGAWPGIDGLGGGLR